MTFDNGPLTGPYIHNLFFCHLICIAIGYGGVWRYQTGTHLFLIFGLDQIELFCRRHIPFSFVISFHFKTDTRTGLTPLESDTEG